MKRYIIALMSSVALLSVVVIPLQAEAVVGTPPNIVIFITDDQPEGMLDAMPTVRGSLQANGVTLNGYIPTSLCCPSRSALLSGQYAHTTGVYENTGANGGWPTFNASGAENRTLAVALDNAGYKTGLFGKYLNGYAGLRPEGYVPPGWDQFRAIFDPGGNPALSAGAYYNYFLVGTGEDAWYGDTAQDYSTDVITKESVQFVNETPADQPFLLYFSTTGTHSPWTPAPRHEGTWHPEPLSPSAYTLTKNRPDWRPDTVVNPDAWIVKQQKAHEALMSVDEGINSVINALGSRVDNTLFVFLSDNGLQFGEHGLTDKNQPYSGSTEVPMLMRWDGVLTAGSSSTPMTNADLTATIAEAAGVSMDNLDGVSYFADNRSDGVVLEATSAKTHPAYCGYRTNRYLYVDYGIDEEFFDYKLDPDELVNKVNAARYVDRVANLSQKAQSACFPTPPGFGW
jgi:N-acetylglucosamine-6-sulfatase